MKALCEVAEPMDYKLDVLVHIQDINEYFYREFVREFLTDRLTLVGFEKDLVRALEAIAGITVYRDDKHDIWVQHKLKGGGSVNDPFVDYESALHFAIGLLHIKK